MPTDNIPPGASCLVRFVFKVILNADNVLLAALNGKRYIFPQTKCKHFKCSIPVSC